ncbi:hypothetical protein AMJ57_03430 [Parcubacteria bacterium SG8_24]|nr:MAG: hypothetical protein AMJ57_03430 [Parcubacteria bacterium SG8_24]
MGDNRIPCSFPECQKSLRPEEAWLPEIKALRRANGGQRVEVDDFARFALCGHHGHLLRQEGVRVYRYLSSVEFAEQAERRRKAEDLKIKAFAGRFVMRTRADGDQRVQVLPPRGRNGRFVRQGLSRLSKLDAAKRKAKEKKAKSST